MTRACPGELASPIEVWRATFRCVHEDCIRTRLQKVVPVEQRTVKDNLGDDTGKHWAVELVPAVFHAPLYNE